MTYTIQSNLLFKVPEYNKKVLYHIYNSNLSLLNKLAKKQVLNSSEDIDLKNCPMTFLICHFHGFEDALLQLEQAKPLFKNYNSEVYKNYKKAIRIARKVKYN